mmetsp:Transcript_39113/g.60952  ORF Transcript_39113/g.60952 Transcript_39113/m.60952 type:complete len:139 (+) Transcript_39113:303-719(+)
MEYSHYLKDRHPELHITSEVMQASAEKRMLAQMVSWGQMAGFAVTFFGTPIFQALSVPVPEWANYMQENKGIAIGAFFMGNMVVSSCVQTGAFEVYFGGELLHSKIKTGQLPDIHVLMDNVSKMSPKGSPEPKQVNSH